MSFSTRKSLAIEPKPNEYVSTVDEELTLQELEYLLSLLKNVDLKGYQVEMFYNLVVKIQSQYVKKNKS